MEEKKKGKFKSRFTVSVGGVEIDLDTDDPGMPDDVRAYCRELSAQFCEIGEEGRFTIGTGNVPECVNRYAMGMVREIGNRYSGITDDVLLGDMEDDRLFDYVRMRASHIAARVAEELPKGIRGGIGETAELLADAFSVVADMDKDWKKLGVKTALDLYLGVVIAMCGLLATVCKDGEGAESDEAAQ